MMNEPKQSSGIPLIIIGAVLIAAFIGAYWYYNSAKPKPTVTNTNGNTPANVAKTPPITTSLGAQPPNMLGSPTAAVTVEEFADFQCPSCASVHPTMKDLQSTYGNRIRFIFRCYPLAIPAHDKAYDAAVAAEAAGMQDRNKFWAMEDQLYTNQQEWTANQNYREIWAGYAEKIGLDIERWKSDMAGKDAKGRVDLDLARGRSMSVDSTPTLFVNGKNVPLQSINTANLRQMIDAEIQNAIKVQPANGANAQAKPVTTAPSNK